MLCSLYLRRCIDIEGLHNPVDQWRAAGGRSHRQRSRRIPPPAEVLPWTQVDMNAKTFRVEETGTGEPAGARIT